MPDQHVTQMDGYQPVAAEAPQTVWQMTAPVDIPAEVSEPEPEPVPSEVSENPEQSAPVAAAEQE